MTTKPKPIGEHREDIAIVAQHFIHVGRQLESDGFSFAAIADGCLSAIVHAIALHAPDGMAYAADYLRRVIEEIETELVPGVEATTLS